MNFEKYNKLLFEVSELYNKIPVKEKTFMDVSGYPHYENVSSNIWAFYFNPNEEHNLNNIVINSFIKVLKNKKINIDLIDNSEVIEISREYTTLNGNRIDLVLQNSNFIIGIENKLDASIYNDLKDYSNTLNKLNKNSIKILLSLYDNSNVVKDTEFINITYQEVFSQLKSNLNNYKDYNNKWYIFLNEFIKNLENYEGEVEMEEEVLKWLKENKDTIEELDKIKEIAHKSIEKKEEELKSLLEDRLHVNFIKIWKGNIEMACYIDSPYKYHVDATLNPTEWKIGLFTWSVSKNNKIKQILLNSKYDIIEDDGNHRWLFKYNYNTPIKEILDKVLELYDYVENIMKEEE